MFDDSHRHRLATVAVITLVILLGVASPGGAVEAERVYDVTQLKAPLPLDAKGAANGWDDVRAVTLPWDVQHQRPATEKSSAKLATDGTYAYARFDVEQREALLAAQRTNNVGDGTDDEVWVDFWPSGTSGFYYQFAATANGTRYQYSSENNVYEPTWDAIGALRPGGYTVTMRIPLSAMRGTKNSSTWRVQFVRVIRSTGERQIWSYASGQSNGDDVTFAGRLVGMTVSAAAKPQPRAGVYLLGEAGSHASGLSTSRAGADFSVPVTETASLFGTVHPDFSNVEVDQSTIAPTAFARFYNEVRPFFTQAGNYFDNFDCDACPGIATLYTPSIPTPRTGYAFAGHQGSAKFGAFDAVGNGRNDSATSFGYKNSAQTIGYFMERIAADCTRPGTTECPLGTAAIHDDTFANGINYNDHRHTDVYFDYASESGTAVAAANRAQRYDGGLYVYDRTTGFAVSARKFGDSFHPADGLVQHPDIAGYAAYGAKIVTFGSHALFNSVGASGFIDRYHDRFGELDQTDTTLTLDALTRTRIDVQGTIGANYLRQDFSCTPGACTFAPVSQNGVAVTYHSGTDNSPGNFPNHGQSSHPTSIGFNTGRFGPGRLDSWTRATTAVAGLRGTISFEADDTRQYLDAGGTNVQWLERFAYTYAPSTDSSLGIGVRRVIGTPPLVFAAAPVSCTTVVTGVQIGGSAPCTGAWNLSFAFHKRLPHDEFYLAYGDASVLSTTPSFILKLLHYFGAEKGT